MAVGANIRVITVLVSIAVVVAVSSCSNTDTKSPAVAMATSTPGQAGQGFRATSRASGPVSAPPDTASSAPTITAASPAQPSASAGPTQVSSYPGIFVGVWSGHSRQLVVNADGSANVSYRSYVFCSQNPAPPCDQVVGNQIIDGGHVRLHIGQVVTAHDMSTATAFVLTSSDPMFVPGSVQRLVLSGDVITWASLGTFCDAKAQARGICGA
jgi:hypothetical protein